MRWFSRLRFSTAVAIKLCTLVAAMALVGCTKVYLTEPIIFSDSSADTRLLGHWNGIAGPDLSVEYGEDINQMYWVELGDRCVVKEINTTHAKGLRFMNTKVGGSYYCTSPDSLAAPSEQDMWQDDLYTVHRYRILPISVEHFLTALRAALYVMEDHEESRSELARLGIETADIQAARKWLNQVTERLASLNPGFEDTTAVEILWWESVSSPRACRYIESQQLGGRCGEETGVGATIITSDPEKIKPLMLLLDQNGIFISYQEFFGTNDGSNDSVGALFTDEIFRDIKSVAALPPGETNILQLLIQLRAWRFIDDEV